MSEQPVAPDDIQHVTQDFIFGNLSSSETLVRSLTEAGRGLRHGNRTLPAVPVAGEPVAVECSVGEDFSVEAVEVLYTTDGSLPDASSTRVEVTRDAVEWRNLN